MKKYILMVFGLLLLSCNKSAVKEDENKDERTELIIREPLKSLLDSLIAIDSDNKEIIQELCIQRYDASRYRIAIISRSYSLDKDYGKPLNYFISNGRKIDIYTGLESFFQPTDTMPLKKELPVTIFRDYIRYRVVEFWIDRDKSKLEDLKIWEVPDYIPFLEISPDFKTYRTMP